LVKRAGVVVEQAAAAAEAVAANFDTYPPRKSRLPVLTARA
jgi:hypothetical protein